MAQGDVLLNGDGTVALDSTGKVRLVDASSDCPDCCDSCTASGTSCSRCDDVSPAEIDITVSSASLCTQCWAFGGIYRKFEYINSPNGITRLRKSGFCTWTIGDSNSLRMREYSDSGCTTQTDTSTHVIAYRLAKSAGTPDTWLLTIWSPNVILGAANRNLIIFEGTVNTAESGGDSLCATVPQITSIYDDSDLDPTGDCFDNVPLNPGGGNSYVIATGGVATGVCV